MERQDDKILRVMKDELHLKHKTFNDLCKLREVIERTEIERGELDLVGEDYKVRYLDVIDVALARHNKLMETMTITEMESLIRARNLRRVQSMQKVVNIKPKPRRFSALLKWWKDREKQKMRFL